MEELDRASRPSGSSVRTTGDGRLFVLGQEGVFFAPERQELYIFNAPATFVWCCVEEASTDAEIVERYAEVFGVDRIRAQADVARLLAQWRGAGYIEQPGLLPEEPVPFEVALTRLIVNPRLRSAFARDPCATAIELNVDLEVRGVFTMLDPTEIDAQANRLQKRASRRDMAMPLADSMLTTAVAGDRTALDLAVARKLQQADAPPIECCYRMLATHVRIRYASAAQAARVHPVLTHLRVEHDPTETSVSLDVVETEEGHVILDELVVRGYARTLQGLAPVVKHLIAQMARARSSYFMEIHAGVVARGDKCLLLPGPSGSGKSTLTLALVESGFDYLSDEVALLDDKTLAVHPFPLSIGIKPPAVPVVERFRPEVAALDVHMRDDGKTVRYVAPARGRCAADVALPARWLIFPRYDPNARTALQPMTPSAALRRLLEQCTSLPELLDETRVERLVQWMRRLPCFDLPMSSLKEAVEQVQHVCTP